MVLTSSKTPKVMRHPSHACDLTVSDSIGAAAQHKDHMHRIIAFQSLAPPTVDLTGDDEIDQDAVVAASPRHGWGNHHRTQVQNNARDVEQEFSKHGVTSRLGRNTTRHMSTARQLNSTAVQNSSPKSEKKSSKPLPFLDFPPEIRNSIYKILLTTPNASIEFPGLTGQNAARHRAQWAKCTTTHMRRRHKKLFLEILIACRYVECQFELPILGRGPTCWHRLLLLYSFYADFETLSRQVHYEASGIIYGCNIFKYRSNPDEGRKSVVLPTRHLQLLKHIKISVVSRHAQKGQREWVADLIKQFVKDDLKLETFELTWYGWARYPLAVAGPICQALRLLQVSKSFVVKMAGEVRMEKAMQEELEKSLMSKRVEIQRPVKGIAGEELSENEAL